MTIPLEENRRMEKKLARGLEDVSHLFLSQPSDRPAGKEEDPGPFPEQPAHGPSPSTIPFLLCASPTVNRDLLVSLMNRNIAVLEEGMRTIDSEVLCDPFGAIDLVAVDSMDQLCIINIDVVQNDELFLRGIACFDWISRNTSIVRRMYHGRVINFSSQPRLFLIAPGFSPLVKCAAQRSSSPKIWCFGYRAAAMPGGIGILLERA
jgi:hypothetical protein